MQFFSGTTKIPHCQNICTTNGSWDYKTTHTNIEHTTDTTRNYILIGHMSTLQCSATTGFEPGTTSFSFRHDNHYITTR